MASDIERRPVEQGPPEEEQPEERWSNILKEVHEASKTGLPWYHQVGIFVAWAAGIGLGMGIVTLLLLLIADLFAAGRLFTGRNASDWLFWASALLLFSGLLAPSTSDSTEPIDPRRPKSATSRTSSAQRAAQSEPPSARSFEERQARAVRKRLLRVYNPWRWRLWASSVVCFSLSVLAGMLAQ